MTFVEELGRWIVTYTAFGREGPGVSLAQTEDFRTFERLGMVMSPEDKNAVLLPRADQRRLGALPPADLGAWRRRLAVALGGPQELARRPSWC